MPEKLIQETACAILSLTTRIAWTEDLPQPMTRRMAGRMLKSGALTGLVLRDTPDIEEKWYERARALLMRVSDVHERMEAYRVGGYRLLIQGDARWPAALRNLGEEEPLFLFVKGDEALLDMPMLAVAGSRKILAETQAAAAQTGRMIAREGALLVTGGASGVDTAAILGALEEGGSAAVIPAMPAEQILKKSPLLRAHERGKLLLVCDTLPDEPFSAAKALLRNHTIYALGDAALVVAARDGRGGSWRGAADCLRGGWSPVYAWDGDNADTAGCRALMKLGARPYALDAPLSAQMAARHTQMNLFEG